MADDGEGSLKDFGASFKGFMETMIAQAPARESVFLSRLRDHFGRDPARLPVVSEKFRKSDHPNVQVALNAYLDADEREFDVLGLGGVHEYFGIELSHLVSPGAAQMFGVMARAKGRFST